MKQLKYFFLFACLLCSAVVLADTTPGSDGGSSVSKAGYKLVFSSETAETASQFLSLTESEKANCTGSFSDQATMEQYWNYCPNEGVTWNRFMPTQLAEQRQNIEFTDGTLNLHAKKVQSAIDGTTKFLTSGVQTKQGFQYGIIEIKAKCNAYTGNFPALWMMPSAPSRGWPHCGEVDIMEMIDNSYKVYGNVHNGSCRCTGDILNLLNNYQGTTTADANYHIFTLVWTSQSMTWYMDGKQFHSYSKKTDKSGEDLDNQWPFDKPFYIIVNQSVGDGSWAKNVDENHEYQMDVAYVRVYQPKTSTFALKTSGPINTSKKYLIVSQEQEGEGLLMNSNFTSSTYGGSNGAGPGQKVCISSDLIQTDMSNAFSFTNASDEKYYIQNNAGYYMGSYNSGNNKYFSVVSTLPSLSSYKARYYNSVEFGSNGEAQILGNYGNSYFLQFDHNEGNNKLLFFYGAYNTNGGLMYLYEEVDGYSIFCNQVADGAVSATTPAGSLVGLAGGETVTLTNTPNEGYSLLEYIVTDDYGQPVTVSADGTFVMPECNVTVSAVFQQLPNSFSISEYEWATFYVNAPFIMPDGVEGYIATVENNKMKLVDTYAPGDVIPANTPLLLNGAEGTYNYSYTQSAEEAPANNNLRGMLTKGNIIAETSGNYYYYKLTTGTDPNTANYGKIGFYWGEQNGGVFKINHDNRAYLILPQTISPAKGYAFQDETNGISNVELENSGILESGIWNLAGQRVDNSYRGIVIKNGKKIMVK